MKKTKEIEGVIKFSYQLKTNDPIDQLLIEDLEKWRALFYAKKLIGSYPVDGLGYGNLSKNVSTSFAPTPFIITGSQTGGLPQLNGHHYTQIIHADLNKQSIEAEGPIAPSSESLTHYGVYLANPKIKYVFHVHSNQLWKFLIENNYPCTEENIGYGTLEMSQNVQKLIKSYGNHFVIAMKGHEDGVMSFGETANIAGELILNLYQQVFHPK